MRRLLFLAFVFAPPLAAQPVPTLQVQMDQVKARVSPMFYGMMTEEINHAYDGGLYGELVQNRIFMDDPAAPVHWSVVGGPAHLVKIDPSQPINDALTRPLLLDASTAATGRPVGVANDGFWGVPVRPQTAYRFSFYAKASPGYRGVIEVRLQSSDGKTDYARAELTGLGMNWKKFETTLQTADLKPVKGRLVLATRTPGKIWFDLVSLFPPTFNDRTNGFRPDLMQLMADLKPAFLRCPGGNYLEGDYFAERFPWESTLGPLEQRPGHPDPWKYRSSDGMGLLEMMEWCEDLHMQPVLAVYAGYSMRQQHVEPGPLLEPYVQSALDEIEYVTGGAGTSWGAKRVRDGHPAPFPLTYVEIGNEDWFDKSGSYDGRFAQFSAAIKAKYPQLLTIATARLRGAACDVLDEHFYPPPTEMDQAAVHYDNYPRNGPKIFVGEWATHAPQLTPDFRAALSDAAWLTGFERNADLVIMESYAPLFINVNPGAWQWQPNLIGYDALTSFGSPSYWLQVMFADSAGDVVPVSSLSHAPPHFYYSVMRNTPSGDLFVKVANATAASQTVHLAIEGASPVNVAPNAQATVLASTDLDACNTLENPRRIAPRREPLTNAAREFDYTFKPDSITVLDLSVR